MRRGTVAIVLGLVMLTGSIFHLDEATPFMNVFNFTTSIVVLLWGVTDKLEARFSSR